MGSSNMANLQSIYLCCWCEVWHLLLLMLLSSWIRIHTQLFTVVCLSWRSGTVVVIVVCVVVLGVDRGDCWLFVAIATGRMGVGLTWSIIATLQKKNYFSAGNFFENNFNFILTKKKPYNALKFFNQTIFFEKVFYRFFWHKHINIFFFWNKLKKISIVGWSTSEFEQ